MSTPAKVHKVTRAGAMWKASRTAYQVLCTCGFASGAYSHRETADLVLDVHVCHGRPKTTRPRAAAPTHIRRTAG